MQNCSELRFEFHDLPTPDCGDIVSSLPYAGKFVVFPGFVDVHVHLREPGFSYKETISTGTAACARGGYTAVCAMPNLNPVPDCDRHLALQEGIISKDARIRVYPFASITVGQLGEQLADLSVMAPRVPGFSDDGRGVQSREIMLEAMKLAKSLGKPIVAHCEDNSLLRGGYIHDGQYAKTHGHRGICSESEWGPIARDLELVAKTGCAYHVCHVSAKESVELIRQAKASGLDVTCETGPHYLAMDDRMLQEDGRFKMNPPLRSSADREALVEGLKDGTVDCIATDHAPHSPEEKSRGLEKSAMGIVGIETAFPVVYTKLVKTGLVPLETVIRALTINPARRFGIPVEGYSIWDLNAVYTVDPADFLSMGKASPFAGTTVWGRNLITFWDGKPVWQYK